MVGVTTVPEWEIQLEQHLYDIPANAELTFNSSINIAVFQIYLYIF